VAKSEKERAPSLRYAKDKAYGYLWGKEAGWSVAWGKVIRGNEK
jgi:hypothetical protein